MTKPMEVLILWAKNFDALVAFSFVHEFQRMGLSVRLITIDDRSDNHKTGDQEETDVFIQPKQGLRESVDMVTRVACLVSPASLAVLSQSPQDPLLWQLIAGVHDSGGKIICGPFVEDVDPTISALLPPQNQFLVYPPIEKLILFARWMAFCLMRGEAPEANHHNGGVPPVIRVGAKSNPGSVAGAMAGIVRQYGFAEAQSIGAAASNQMLKSSAIAKSYLASDELSLYIVPEFTNVQINGQTRSAIRLLISAWPKEVG